MDPKQTNRWSAYGTWRQAPYPPDERKKLLLSLSNKYRLADLELISYVQVAYGKTEQCMCAYPAGLKK